MKHNKIFSLLLALGVVAFISCNNSADTAANEDSTSNTANTTTSTSDYSAYADEIEKNSTQGYYANPKTGKPYGKLSMNRSTGEITDENNEPVWRYVDTRNWWVYGVDDDWNWSRIGEARMDNGALMYKDDSGNWVTYEKRWSTNDETINSKWKSKSGDTKIKFDKDGDIKIKDDTSKVKYDADDNKIKTDSSK